MMREALQKALARKDLTRGEAGVVMEEIMSGEATPAQIAGLLIALRMKGETSDEITGFAESMRQHAVRVPTSREPLLDTCGTGGDNLNTFNISTAAALVVAGAGVAVAKHGNRSVSSACGSADVLETLGVNLNLSADQVGRCIDEIGIGFLFAPMLHPAMKHAIGPRREMGVRTVFNLLGPLTNPAGARRQLLGVYAQELTDVIACVLLNLGCEHAMVVHGLCGLDELSLSGETQISHLKHGRVQTYSVKPEDVELVRTSLASLRGASPKENATLLRAVLDGEPGPRLDAVLLNSAAALVVADRAQNLTEGIDVARESVASGAAVEKLQQLIAFTRRLVTEP